MARTLLGVALAASFAIAIMILQMSGLSAVLGVGSTDEYVVDDEFEEQAKETPEAVGGSTGGSDVGLKFIVASAWQCSCRSR